MNIRRILLIVAVFVSMLNVSSQTPYHMMDGEQGALVTKKVEKNKDFNFVVLSDLHISEENQTSSEDLRRVVKELNLNNTLAFVIVSGDVTEKGDRASLLAAKKMLDELNCAYYVVPGNRDVRRSESAGVDFRRVFGDDKFRIQINDYMFLGVNTGEAFHGAEGHVAPQDLVWVQRQLKNIGKKKPVFVVAHHPLKTGDVDNWWELTDVVRRHNVQAFIGGHYHRNALLNYDAIPGVIIRSTMRGNDVNGAYTLCAMRSDTLYVSEKIVGQAEKLWLKLGVERKMYVEGDEAEFVRADYSVRADFRQIKEKWLIEGERGIYTAPIVVGDKVVYADDKGSLRCVTYAKGKKVWSFESVLPIFSTAIVVDDKIVFGSSDNAVYCVNLNTGRMLWMLPTKGAVLGSPVHDDGVVFIGASDNKMRAVNIENGEELWSFDDMGDYQESKPVVVDERVMFGAWDGNFYCLNKYNGTLIWKWNASDNRRNAPSAVWPVVVDDKVYVATPDEFIVVLNAQTGEELWRTNNYKVNGSMTVSEDEKMVFFKTKRDTVIAIDATSDDMRVLWTKNVGYGMDNSVVAMSEKGGSLLFATQYGLVVCLDSATGEVKWKHKVAHEIVNKVEIVDERNWVLTTVGGDVMRLEQK